MEIYEVISVIVFVAILLVVPTVVKFKGSTLDSEEWVFLLVIAAAVAIGWPYILGFGAIAAIIYGIWIGLYRTLDWVTDHLVKVARKLPKVHITLEKD